MRVPLTPLLFPCVLALLTACGNKPAYQPDFHRAVAAVLAAEIAADHPGGGDVLVIYPAGSHPLAEAVVRSWREGIDSVLTPDAFTLHFSGEQANKAFAESESGQITQKEWEEALARVSRPVAVLSFAGLPPVPSLPQGASLYLDASEIVPPFLDFPFLRAAAVVSPTADYHVRPARNLPHKEVFSIRFKLLRDFPPDS